MAASFVRKAEDVRSIRRFIARVHSKHWPEDRPTARIISKIENLGETVVELGSGSMLLVCRAVWAIGTNRTEREAASFLLHAFSTVGLFLVAPWLMFD